MKSIKPAFLLFFVIMYGTCSFGQIWKQYTDSAKAFLEQKKMDKAIEFYGKAKEELKRDSIGTISYAASCNNLANLTSYMGQYVKAVPLYLEAKQIRKKVLGMKHPDYAASCNSLGILYEKMGQYTKAERLYLEAALSSFMWQDENAKTPQMESKQRQVFDLFFSLLEIFGPGEIEIEKQIREKVSGKEDSNYAHARNNLGGLYYTMGQYEKAELPLWEAKQIWEKMLGKEHPYYASSCKNLAKLYNTLGQHEKAEKLYLEGMQIWEKVLVLGNEHPDYASSCNNLADYYANMEQYEKAEPLYLQAKQVQEKGLGMEHPEYAASNMNLGSLYQLMGQNEKAGSLYLEAKQILEKAFGKEHSDYAASCNSLANLYRDKGQYEKAEALYLEAKQIREKVLGKQHPDYGSSCANLANFYWVLHQPLRAETEFKELFFVNASKLFSVFQFTNEKEKTAFIRNILVEDDKTYSFYLSEKLESEQPYSLSLFHRNLILSSSQALKKQLFSVNDTALINKYNEWLDLRNYLSILYSKPFDERKEDAGQIEEEAGQLEKEFARLSSGFKKQQQKLEWIDIQNNLQADEASIEFASFHFYDRKRITDTVLYVALVLRKDSLLPAIIRLFNERQLTTLLAFTGNQTTSDAIKKLYASKGAGRQSNPFTNKSIYDLIWKPIEKELKGIKTIYFAPSGMLHRIAFAGLPVNKKEVLSDRYKLVQLATTASVADQRRYFVTASDKIQLYGGISYHVDTTALKDAVLSYHKNEKVLNRSLPPDLTRSGKLNDLPGTKKEIEGILSFSDEYKTNITSVSGINATEESLKALDGMASPTVLHIASHGFFFPDPKQDEKSHLRGFESGKVFKLSDDPLMRSGLLFAGANHAWQNKPVEGIDDGILTAYEVSNLYLANTKLVVLSACETGLGDIQGSEGVYGLQRAFKMAGIENIVMSLWKVPDLATAEFMQGLYKNLFAKQSISDAFYNAQKVMKNKYRLQPHKWAAWVLVR